MASLEKRARNGLLRWRVVWRQDGEKQQRTYATHAEAVAFRARVEAYTNCWPPGEDPRRPAETPVLTFGAWAQLAIDGRSRANERTKADYRRDFERHFADLAPLAVAELTTVDVARWEAGLRAAGLSDKTVRNLHGFGSSIMADAVSQHPPIATHNPFANRLAKSVAVRTEEMVFFTPGEFETILRHVPDEKNYRQLVRLLYGTGLRYGEATALQVRDVVLLGRRKTLTVTKAWKRDGDSGYAVGEPKTLRSRRTLSLSPQLVDMLIPLVSARRGDELLFPGSGGDRLPHTEFYKRAWSPAVARANVCDVHWEPQRTRRSLNERPRLPEPCDCTGVLGKRPRIHDIRHSWVSALLAEGVRLEVVSRRAGHSSITITFDRYGHLDTSHDAEVDAAVDRVLARH